MNNISVGDILMDSNEIYRVTSILHSNDPYILVETFLSGYGWQLDEAEPHGFSLSEMNKYDLVHYKNAKQGLA